MSIQPEEITRILKERLEGVSLSTEMKEVGSVLQVGDGIARVYGLGNAWPAKCWRFPTAWWASF
jgi:F-type H+-transporting ATPase subunit alpha